MVIGNSANRERFNPCTTMRRLNLPNWAARDKHTVEDSRYQISLDSISFAGYRKCAIIHSTTVPVRKTVEIIGVAYWACQFNLAISIETFISVDSPFIGIASSTLLTV